MHAPSSQGVDVLIFSPVNVFRLACTSMPCVSVIGDRYYDICHCFIAYPNDASQRSTSAGSSTGDLGYLFNWFASKILEQPVNAIN